MGLRSWLFLLWVAFSAGSPLLSQDLGRIELSGPSAHPYLASSLGEVAEVARDRGRDRALDLARSRHLPMQGDRVLVTILPVSGDAGDLPDSLLRGLGVEVKARAGRTLLVAVPVDRLEELAKGLVQPAALLPAIGGQPQVELGAMMTGAASYPLNGSSGAGIRVAVIDGGFEDLSTVVASGDLSVFFSHSFVGPLEANGDHGTNCALIVQQMAPDAELYLYKVGDPTTLALAVQDCINKGVDIISHSMSWYGFGFYDGTGLICDIAEMATSAGIVWVNSAGNKARKHWAGSWSDADNNLLHNFDSTREVLPIDLDKDEVLLVFLTWDEFGAPAPNDYNLHLTDSNNVPIVSSMNLQPLFPLPQETLLFTAPSAGTYNLLISRNPLSATTGNFHLFVAQGNELDPADRVAAGSVTDPGTSPSVIAVAAMDWQVYDDLLPGVMSYSSRGPTSDGRIKPDITAPTNVVTPLSTTGFGGTSCACPHVAGALALYMADPNKMGDAVGNLFADCVDRGDVGFDNSFGQGKMELEPYDDIHEENDQAAAAGLLSLGTHRDLIAIDDDWYLVRLPGAGSLEVRVTFMDVFADLDVQIEGLDATGATVFTWFVTSNDDNEEIVVSSFSGVTDFRIRIFLDEREFNLYDLDLRYIDPSGSPPGEEERDDEEERSREDEERGSNDKKRCRKDEKRSRSAHDPRPR